MFLPYQASALYGTNPSFGLGNDFIRGRQRLACPYTRSSKTQADAHSPYDVQNP